MKAPSDKSIRIISGFVCGLIACLLYSGTLNNDFVMDDTVAILENPIISSPLNLKEILFSNAWGNRPGLSHIPNYRPLTTFTFYLNNLLSGHEPVNYHLINNILHGLVTIFIFFLSLRIFGSLLSALLSGLLFAFLPVHTEAVAEAVNREELMSLMFYISSFIFYMKIDDQSDRLKKCIYFTISLIFYISGLLSKESAATFPFVLILLEITITQNNASLKERLSHLYRKAIFIIPYFLIIPLYLGLRYLALGQVFAGSPPFIINPLIEATLSERILTAFSILYETFCLLISPLHMSIDYSFNSIPKVTTIFNYNFLMGLMILILLVSLFILSLKKKSPIAFGTGFFLISYILISNFFFANTTIFGERLLYTPSAGYCLLISGLISEILKKIYKNIVKIFALFAFITIIISYAILTIERIGNFKNDLSLFASSLINRPNNTRLYSFVGKQLIAERRYEEAEFFFEESLKIYPKNSEAHLSLGVLAMDSGNIERAYHHIYTGLSSSPSSLGMNILCILHLMKNKPQADQICMEAFRTEFVKGFLIKNIMDTVNRQIEKGHMIDAKQLLYNAIELFPWEGLLYLKLSSVFIIEKDFINANFLCKMALEINTEIPLQFKSILKDYGGCK